VGALDPDGNIVVTGGCGYPTPADFYTARFLGDSSSPSTTLASAAISATASSPDSTFAAIALDETLFFDALATRKRRGG
jgi:hypothetical protein